jgi:glycosyltransferase involved in cell wall biosynthesis
VKKVNKISVIILLQNSQCNNLINIINSLHDQTVKNFEIIIVGQENPAKQLNKQ